MANARTAASVNVSHPFFECEFAWCARTVSDALSISTPCVAHPSRSPCVGFVHPRSVPSSLKMFCSEDGTFHPRGTEKLRPIAWPSSWYGSWPRITTFTRSIGHVLNARKMFPGAGNTFAPEFHSRLRNDFRLDMYSFLNSPSRMSRHVCSTSRASRSGVSPAFLAASHTSVALRCSCLLIATCLLRSARCLCASVKPSRGAAVSAGRLEAFVPGLFAGLVPTALETGAGTGSTASVALGFFATGAKND